MEKKEESNLSGQKHEIKMLKAIYLVIVRGIAFKMVKITITFNTSNSIIDK